MARLKLATYNINGIRARLPALLEWLEREKPDIACLQELKAPDEAFPASDIERLGYGAIWHGQKSWNGVAILARGAQPEERRRALPGDPDDTHSRYLEASVHGLVVGALYLPNGNPWPGPKFDYKLAWFARLLRHAKKLLDAGDPVVLAGDFNVVPTDELDIYDPKSWRKDALLQPESREAWFRLLGQGWTDALRTVAGDAKVFTFWDYFRKHWERDAGLRIDHLLLSPDLAATLADAGVDRWVRGRPGASDHAPTWVLLDAESGRRSKPAAARGGRRPAAARAADVAPGKKTADARRKPAAGGGRRAASSAGALPQQTSVEKMDAAGPLASNPAATKESARKATVGTSAARKTSAGKASVKKAAVKRAAVKKAASGTVATAKTPARKARVATTTARGRDRV